MCIKSFFQPNLLKQREPYRLPLFTLIFVIFAKKLASKTLNDQFLQKTLFFMLRYGSRSYNFYRVKKRKKLHFWYATVDAKFRFLKLNTVTGGSPLFTKISSVPYRTSPSIVLKKARHLNEFSVKNAIQRLPQRTKNAVFSFL